MEVVREVWALMGLRGSGGMEMKLLGRCIYGLGRLRLTIVVERGLGMLTVCQLYSKQAVEYSKPALDGRDDDTYQDPASQEASLD